MIGLYNRSERWFCHFPRVQEIPFLLGGQRGAYPSLVTCATQLLVVPVCTSVFVHFTSSMCSQLSTFHDKIRPPGVHIDKTTWKSVFWELEVLEHMSTPNVHSTRHVYWAYVENRKPFVVHVFVFSFHHVESVFITLSVVDSMSDNLLRGVSELWWDCHSDTPTALCDHVSDKCISTAFCQYANMKYSKWKVWGLVPPTKHLHYRQTDRHAWKLLIWHRTALVDR